VSASPVTLVGNLTADPELKFLPTGVGKLTFGIAVNHYWTDQDGEKQEKTSFFNITAWRNLAEESANVLTKGVKVVVTGRLEQRSWDDKETGAKRSTVEVLADNIGLSVGNIESFVRKQRAEGATPFAPKAKTASAPARTAPKQIAQVQVEEEEAW
jgi:single-strand DNA-binding protein